MSVSFMSLKSRHAVKTLCGVWAKCAIVHYYSVLGAFCWTHDDINSSK